MAATSPTNHPKPSRNKPMTSPSRLNTAPSPPLDLRALRSPTLHEMISLERAQDPKPTETHKKRVSTLLSSCSHFQHCNEQWGVGDVRLKMVEKDTAFEMSMAVHRRILASKSRFFAKKLVGRGGTHSVEILDCDDVEAYVEAVMLMYSCDDDDDDAFFNLKSKLMGLDVPKILSLLKVSSDLMFDHGISACLEYLEAIHWSEEEEESVVSHLNQLQLDNARTDDVLQRVRAEPSTSSRANDIFLQLSLGVIQAKHEKARGEMKAFLHRLLKEDPANIHFLDISKDVLYHLCHRCLSSLILCLSEATSSDFETRSDRGNLMAKIARDADNLLWIVEIMIERKMGDEFVQLWADQKELAVLHSKIPIVYRHEISKITAQLCVAIGRGHILVPKSTRYCLLSTWLEALYSDFGWMGRVGKSIDRKLVEEGLAQTILTLTLPQQQSILLNWFDGFLNRGDDYPNIQRAFETWWRRAFVKQCEVESQMQITVCDVPNY